MLYFALFRKSFQRMVAYRSATLAGIATNFFFGLLRASVFLAVFEASGAQTIGGYRLQDTLTFAALTQALGTPLNIFRFDTNIMRTIGSGEIAMELSKPFHYFSFWLCRDLGRATFQLLFRGAPVLLFFPFFFALTWPDSLSRWGLASLSVLLAMLISFCWRFLINILAFWWVNAEGVGRFAWLAMAFFSGFLIPVSFFPDWLARLASFTPLPSIVNTPVEIYLGLLRGRALWSGLSTQLAWLVVLTLLCHWGFERGRLRLSVQGG